MIRVSLKCRRTQQTGQCQQETTVTTRYSELKQITNQNVGKLQAAWSFSTGVLRGHEGAPLVIGDVMYLNAPFPNTVYALDLNHDGRILWEVRAHAGPERHPRHVLRHGEPWRRLR